LNQGIDHVVTNTTTGTSYENPLSGHGIGRMEWV
jgi:hypothetical protein